MGFLRFTLDSPVARIPAAERGLMFVRTSKKIPFLRILGEKRDPGSEQVRVHLASKRNQEKCRLTSGIRRHRRSTLVI